MVNFSLFIISLLSIFCHEDQSGKSIANPINPFDYNLSDPDKIYTLPSVLNEISGISETGASSIACIQDENGILFFYDLIKEQINKKYSFYSDGDYEGIARVDKAVYILRSDGTLFEIANYESALFKRVIYKMGSIGKDNEGLCFDRKANRLLIAPKGEPGEKSGYKNKRVIYAFDLKSKKLSEKPVFVFDLSVIKKFALDNKIKVPMEKGKKEDKKKPIIELNTSAIGIHPYTNRLFVVSGMERLLFVFDMNGKIEYLEKLDSDIYNQPEGITFLTNGDMLISNERGDKKPTIVRCNYLRE